VTTRYGPDSRIVAGLSLAVLIAVTGCTTVVSRYVAAPTTTSAATTVAHSALFTWWGAHFDEIATVMDDVNRFTADWNLTGTPQFNWNQVDADVDQIKQDLPAAEAVPPAPDPVATGDYQQFLQDVDAAASAWSPSTTIPYQSINDFNASDLAWRQLVRAIPNS
jgi:hypothetical protein